MLSVKDIEKELGANYREGTEDVLLLILDRVSQMASNISNYPKDDPSMAPYIIEAVKAEYNALGAEGFSSENKGSMSTSFKNIIEDMRNNLIISGKRKIK